MAVSSLSQKGNPEQRFRYSWARGLSHRLRDSFINSQIQWGLKVTFISLLICPLVYEANRASGNLAGGACAYRFRFTFLGNTNIYIPKFRPWSCSAFIFLISYLPISAFLVWKPPLEYCKLRLQRSFVLCVSRSCYDASGLFIFFECSIRPYHFPTSGLCSPTRLCACIVTFLKRCHTIVFPMSAVYLRAFEPRWVHTIRELTNPAQIAYLCTLMTWLIQFSYLVALARGYTRQSFCIGHLDRHACLHIHHKNTPNIHE